MRIFITIIITILIAIPCQIAGYVWNIASGWFEEGRRISENDYERWVYIINRVEKRLKGTS